MAPVPAVPAVAPVAPVAAVPVAVPVLATSVGVLLWLPLARLRSAEVEVNAEDLILLSWVRLLRPEVLGVVGVVGAVGLSVLVEESVGTLVSVEPVEPVEPVEVLAAELTPRLKPELVEEDALEGSELGTTPLVWLWPSPEQRPWHTVLEPDPLDPGVWVVLLLVAPFPLSIGGAVPSVGVVRVWVGAVVVGGSVCVCVLVVGVSVCVGVVVVVVSVCVGVVVVSVCVGVVVVSV